jgi:glycosyltransferase involved in cell wall biosynthesis
MPVSIGIPFFNPGPAFEKAVRSVFAQTMSDWELILIDDGSHDGSVELARAISDPRVHVVSDGHNKGLCARLNQIAALAKFDLLCRMDADDLMHPERLQKQVARFDLDPAIDLMGTAAVAIDDRDFPMCLLGKPIDESQVEREALGRTLFVHPSVLGKREWFRANPYDPAYPRSEDHELWLRAARWSRYAFLPEPLVFYRQPLSFNLRAYVATCRTDRKIFRRYGPNTVGLPKTAALLTRSFAFEAIHRGATAAGLASPLMRMRGSALPDATLMDHRQAITRAVNAHVPGWSAQ